MKHIPTRLMQKVKNHFNERSVKKSSKKFQHHYEDVNDHALYTGAIGPADIQRLKSSDAEPQK